MDGILELLQQPPYWLWVVLGLALMSVEVLVPGVFLLWLGIAALAVGGLVALSPTLSLSAQLIAFAIFAATAVWVALKYFRPQDQVSDQPRLNQRGAWYLGQQFVTSEAVVNGWGRLKIGDSTWAMRGPDCATGSTVRVTAVDGAVLVVELVTPAASPKSP